MKKHFSVHFLWEISLVVALILSSQVTFAQQVDVNSTTDVNQRWGVKGNINTNPTVNYLGNFDAKDLVIRTNNLERMRITTAGNVGIGTSSPSAKLMISDPSTPSLMINGGSANIQMAVATQAGFYSDIATPGDAVIRATSGSTQDLILTTRNYNSGSIRFATQAAATGVESEKMTLANNGRLGIGTPAPTALLHLKETAGSPMSEIRLEDDYIESGTTEKTDLTIRSANGSGRLISNQSLTFFLDADNNDADIRTFEILKNASSFNSNAKVLFRVYETGNADLCGTFLAKKLVVQSGWCDYVFEEDYKLMDIKELEAYIKINKHLPGIPSASTIENEGLDVADVQAKMMLKIEELTLYLLKQNQQLEGLSAQNKQLQDALGQLQNAKR